MTLTENLGCKHYSKAFQAVVDIENSESVLVVAFNYKKRIEDCREDVQKLASIATVAQFAIALKTFEKWASVENFELYSIDVSVEGTAFNFANDAIKEKLLKIADCFIGAGFDLSSPLTIKKMIVAARWRYSRLSDCTVADAAIEYTLKYCETITADCLDYTAVHFLNFSKLDDLKKLNFLKIEYQDADSVIHLIDFIDTRRLLEALNYTVFINDDCDLLVFEG